MFPANPAIYDQPSVRSRYVTPSGDGRLETTLLLTGLSCPACALSIERGLQRLPGVAEAAVNFSTHRMRVSWEPARLELSAILDAVSNLGYGAHPYDPGSNEARLEAENRAHLRRLGVAGALGMQVMMMTAALYAGAWYGMDLEFERLFEALSLALTVVVVGYAGLPFLRGAVRDLRTGALGMDVPVSLGIVIALAASAVSTVTGDGDVYYESVVMFVFLLLLSRYLQFLAARKSALTQETLSHSVPATANRLRGLGQSLELVPAELLEPGDRVLVRPGETVPADGLLTRGKTSLSEALLSGESEPRLREEGDRLLGGAINVENPIELRVTARSAEGTLASLSKLIERARLDKPPVVRLADRVASGFIAGVLVLAACVAGYWWIADPERWLAVTVSVLVVTCPCALSLAAPTVIASTIGSLARRGMIVSSTAAIENLGRATRFVFDKTGTLTRGHYTLEAVHPVGNADTEHCLRIAAALERGSEHPLAKALLRSNGSSPLLFAHEIRNIAGRGVTGLIDGAAYVLGSVDFVESELGAALPCSVRELSATPARTVVALAARETGPVAAFVLSDALRADAVPLIEYLRVLGRRLSLYSGDGRNAVEVIARQVGIEDIATGVSPDEKLRRVKALQVAGEIVAMVGDGLNDAPAVASADVSVAMGPGTAATLANADVVLVSDRLADLEQGVRLARKARLVLIQNLCWAVLYNLVALPVAAAGLIAPWMAALGMSLSSLAVVGNSLRLCRSGDD